MSLNWSQHIISLDKGTKLDEFERNLWWHEFWFNKP